MKFCELNFLAGKKQDAMEIIKEAAMWLIKKGEPLWSVCDIETELAEIKEDKFIVLYKNDISIAAMVLNEDGNGLWNDEKKSVFIHKLAVKRKYAGQRYAEKMIEYAVDYCRKNKMRYLRLDCDGKREKLRQFYEKAGFLLKDIKNITTKKHGKIKVALYEIDIRQLYF